MFFILNTFGLIISISTLFIFYNNIDPNVQFRDSEVLYVNNDNPNEKIIRQYDINWKTNKKEFFNNHVLDIGFFRIYKSYGIDIHKLNSNWK
ncbi:hypothetical protein [Flammeovirga kamogawensis]|uniref:Uncharacterized protein n=1 Tax=Flammeovirga kamogawensis TaxID=373891 RepID=A0ABX8H2J3_9BACT|nr:hypothetical protein [Flammeovirga kamogawensis]MBB6464113.1 hypothetical protein [Flammeovirga kamogawensis]QWG09889.1 hypothetical protein KM029_19605 [Flammeovirga kamogawensis]